MKRIKQFCQHSPKAAKVIINLCFGIGVLMFAGRFVAPLLAFVGEWLYKFCKATVLFVFPDMSHDAKIILSAIGLFSIPLLIMLFKTALSKMIGRVKRKSV